MFGTTVLGICNVKQIFTMAIRISYFRSPFWFALILMRCMTLYNLAPLPSSSLFVLQQIWGSLVSAAAYFFIFESSQLSEFSSDLQDSGL